MRPVIRVSDPPCTAPALPETQAGRLVRCDELGPVGVDASDVTSATVALGAPNTGNVQYVLSPEGVARFNTLARAVGVGHQMAVVVDGAVVSAPTLETTEFSGRGVVAGLDADTAQRLAKRLNRQ